MRWQRSCSDTTHCHARNIACSRAETSSEDEDGWANLSAVGVLMRKQQPDFDSRNWGYAKLSDLVSATDHFVLETLPTGGMKVQNKRKAGE